MSLLDEARDAPTRTYRHYGNGIGFPFTSENHRVHISAEARDALVELADKALVVEEWLRGAGYEGTADELLPALERLQR